MRYHFTFMHARFALKLAEIYLEEKSAKNLPRGLTTHN